MKVYVIWYIPDYIGIDIVGVYSTKEKADAAYERWLNEGWNRELFGNDQSGIDDYEVDYE